ncbi:MAG: FAD:protein FMN transferase [Acidimicrobiaceae bacterium]|nr:FAD:protein FMN transferase [Acidimicrobiaceae bacterium]
MQYLDPGVPPVVNSFRAMATSVTVSICPELPAGNVDSSIAKVTRVFHETESACSRFNPNSDLSQLNQSPAHWHSVTPYCFKAIEEAFRAYVMTHGLFDPRVLSDLLALGYKESWTTGIPESRIENADQVRKPLPVWTPMFKGDNHILAGEFPLDLGGIGKGLALRWSGKEIASEHTNFLIEAGGDCVCSGDGPDHAGWNIGVQNPFQQDGDPSLVLRLSNSAVCTSSTAVRSWWQNGSLKHHIVDPETGKSGGKGLAAVTVVAEDPAEAEIWSKSLFLTGKDKIGEFSESSNICAAWVTDMGETSTNSLIRNHIIWMSP